MGKYRDLIDQLNVDEFGVEQRHTARKALVDADGRALPALMYALLNHENEWVRETVAEILGERKQTKAIPALIDALDDEALIVRQDALWSIEMICMLQPAALSVWLDLSAELEDARPRVLQWWALNRTFIEHNPNLM